MSEIISINSDKIYEAIYSACYDANIYLSSDVYEKLNNIYNLGIDEKSKLSQILKNVYIANVDKRPLCQDTGQVVVFVEIGQNIHVVGDLLNDVINKAVEDCYKENFFRKSIVLDAFFNRKNSKTNTPVIIYTNIVKENHIKFDILIKGGGAENMSKTIMLTPSATKNELFDFVKDVVVSSKTNACPPLFLGVGIGGTLDYASVLSKKAFFKDSEDDFEKELVQYINENSDTKVAGLKILSSSTHIACMPVCVTINCHSTRHSSVVIDGNSNIKKLTKYANPFFISDELIEVPELNTCDVEKIRTLKKGDEIYLSGEIYTARDMAHKKIFEMLENGEALPIEIKDKIIFYAGPCPKNNSEVIGPIGPTTSKRMDKFASKLYDMGLLATIGKGERSDDVLASIKRNNSVYFSVTGGVASLLKNCIKSAEIVAFDEFGAEAIYRLVVDKLPLKVE